uniref:Uncharacterized protein LOC102802569 n=1 Tax=Saccoglossus kowalevskii TaxID=10224 RepID=A0ABM0LXQ4_SACKO|nr:PREDICTED: uncharacterized protein LOC102802569 [Saccoglossus kowalevskii]
MFQLMFLFLVFVVSVETVELNGGFRHIKYADYERLKFAAGWLDCGRIVLYIQRRNMEHYIRYIQITWDITITITGEKGLNVTDNFLGSAATKIYDAGFESCKSYTMKWTANEKRRTPSERPLSNMKGEQVIKMPCKCEQSVIEMEPFKLQTMNGAKYTFPSQSESGTRDYVFLRECNILKTRISINGSVTSMGPTAQLNSVQYSFPNLVHAPHVLTMNPQGVPELNGRGNVNVHDDHYAGAEWFIGNDKFIMVFTNIEVRVLWDYKEKTITIAAGEEFDACGLLTYGNGKASDNVQQLPKEFVKECVISKR